MLAHSNAQTQWELLHKQERFLPLYPNESVVRFIMTQFPKERNEREKLRILDLGCGAGRHTLLLNECGFQTFATDISFPGLVVTRNRLEERHQSAHLACMDMRQLAFPDGFFAGILAFGVVIYNDYRGVHETINELYRITAEGGKIQVVVRTTRDYRYGKGQPVDSHSFILQIEETNEKDMLMCFLTKTNVRRVFKNFRQVLIDRIETTTGEWRVDSDWIITATK